MKDDYVSRDLEGARGFQDFHNSDNDDEYDVWDEEQDDEDDDDCNCSDPGCPCRGHKTGRL